MHSTELHLRNCKLKCVDSAFNALHYTNKCTKKISKKNKKAKSFWRTLKKLKRVHHKQAQTTKKVQKVKSMADESQTQFKKVYRKCRQDVYTCKKVCVLYQK